MADETGKSKRSHRLVLAGAGAALVAITIGAVAIAASGHGDPPKRHVEQAAAAQQAPAVTAVGMSAPAQYGAFLLLPPGSVPQRIMTYGDVRDGLVYVDKEASTEAALPDDRLAARPAVLPANYRMTDARFTVGNSAASGQSAVISVEAVYDDGVHPPVYVLQTRPTELAHALPYPIVLQSDDSPLVTEPGNVAGHPAMFTHPRPGKSGVYQEVAVADGEVMISVRTDGGADFGLLIQIAASLVPGGTP